MNRKTVKCPYCRAQATLRHASAVHGEKARDEYLYVCSRFPLCDSYVGVHAKSRKPLGSLANKELRRKRMQTHAVFNQLWTTGLMKKWQAYKWMQGKFALSNSQAHIAGFSEYMCDELIRLCEQVLVNNRIAA